MLRALCMRRDKAVLDSKGVLRRGPRGARVWVEIYPLKPAQAQASRATFPTHWDRKGSRLWCITGSSRSTRPPPGAHSTVWTRWRRGRAWPLSRRSGPDARSITATGPSAGTRSNRNLCHTWNG
jgi:hypothetical protein